MQKTGIAVVGFGVVGGGTVDQLQQHSALIQERTGVEIELKYVVVRDTSKARSTALNHARLISDYRVALSDPAVKIIVELIGGTDVAHAIVEEALRAGKSVVTANKALLAEHGQGLLRIARDNGAAIAFEASVCGGIPIVRTLWDGLSGDRVTRLYGILNGTTNYILTRMSEEHLGFDEALSMARDRGLAEADPSLDVGGHDAAHKLAILASLAFQTDLPPHAIHREGIERLQQEDVHYAGELGYRVKLLGMACRGSAESPGTREAPSPQPEVVEARVHPTLVPEGNLLAAVRDEDNAVVVESDFLGRSLYYGKGAGARPTASAVVADIVELARNADRPARALKHAPSRAVRAVAIEDVESRYYVRFQVADRIGVLHGIVAKLAASSVGIESVIQKGRSSEGLVPLVITTHRARERDLRHALASIRELAHSEVTDSTFIRILE